MGFSIMFIRQNLPMRLATVKGSFLFILVILIIMLHHFYDRNQNNLIDNAERLVY